MNTLSQVKIEGFRSIRSSTIQLGPVNILIGANGAGKSNLIDFFRMLNYCLSRGFQNPYLIQRGPASSILHFGPKTTGVVRGELVFETDAGTNFYRFTLADSSGDRLTFTKEEVEFRRGGAKAGSSVNLLQHPSEESGLTELWADGDATARFTKQFLRRCRVFQFHDTSLSSHFRDYSPADQSSFLYADGGNLSALLLRLREDFPASYREIIDTLRALLPWFQDFELESEGRQGVLLRWRMAGQADYLFGPGQLSDGSLRIMALVTLLCLPPDQQPHLIILDEPELGLHPAAEQVIAGLIQKVSRETQVLVSTQSATFIDHFSADDIVVVDNEEGASTFTRLSEERLSQWLERYTLGQLWSKNVLGGRP